MFKSKKDITVNFSKRMKTFSHISRANTRYANNQAHYGKLEFVFLGT